MLCGRYEGVDQRVREHLVDHEISVGDVVLAGGEVAACLIIEAVTRLIPGVMGNSDSPVTESFGVTGLLEEPQYTRPADYRGWEVPEVPTRVIPDEGIPDELERLAAAFAKAADRLEQVLPDAAGADDAEHGGGAHVELEPEERRRQHDWCEVRHECLEYALAHDERFGIWGGLTEYERKTLLTSSAAG